MYWEQNLLLFPNKYVIIRLYRLIRKEYVDNSKRLYLWSR